MIAMREVRLFMVTAAQIEHSDTFVVRRVNSSSSSNSDGVEMRTFQRGGILNTVPSSAVPTVLQWRGAARRSLNCDLHERAQSGALSTSAQSDIPAPVTHTIRYDMLHLLL